MVTTTGGAGEFMELDVTLIKVADNGFLAHFLDAKKTLFINEEEEFLGHWRRYTNPEDAHGKKIRVRLRQQRAIKLELFGAQTYGTGRQGSAEIPGRKIP